MSPENANGDKMSDATPKTYCRKYVCKIKQRTFPAMNPLPWLIRYYVYGLQGFCDEIVFTSIFDFFSHGDWRLRGHSAISSFFIYGTCSFLVERLYLYLWYKKRVPRYIRMPLYVLIAYSWEFMTGFILRQFNACPWDYSHYKFNIMGLITMEYAPGWLFLSYLQDVLADFLLRINVTQTLDENAKMKKM